MPKHEGAGNLRTMTLEFWYEFASTYSYLSAMRIENLAKEKGVGVSWKPFLLGPIFHSQGWDNSPFNIYPAKGAYMWRDMARQCDKYGLLFRRPDIFPVHSVTAARLALIGAQDGWCPDFTCRVYHAQFADGQDVSDRHVLAGVLTDMDLDATMLLEKNGYARNQDRPEGTDGQSRREGHLRGAELRCGRGTVLGKRSPGGCHRPGCKSEQGKKLT